MIGRLLILIAWLPLAQAATLRVGPDEAITRIAEAARLARDGDLVEIMPGEYRGDVAVWQQKALTIRGVGQRPVLVADGKNAENKAIWVIRNGDIRIENIEFRDARVPDGIGAGIRFERGRLAVRDCVFADNQIGILTANFADAELTIRDSLFARAPHQLNALPHLLYVGRIGRFEITGSRFEAGFRGHLIKSRAKVSDIRYNLVHDGPDGQASYEIDLPDGGVATLIGNIVGQSRNTQNPVVVSYGEEGGPWPENSLTVIHNTLLSDRPQGTDFVRVSREKFASPPRVLIANNLTVSLAAFAFPAGAGFRGNVHAQPALLSAPHSLDFTLPAGSALRQPGAVIDGLADEYLPKAEFSLPIGTRPLAPPTRWAAGALQTER